jgi:hypothetical protein
MASQSKTFSDSYAYRVFLSDGALGFNISRLINASAGEGLSCELNATPKPADWRKTLGMALAPVVK